MWNRKEIETARSKLSDAAYSAFQPTIGLTNDNDADSHKKMTDDPTAGVSSHGLLFWSMHMCGVADTKNRLSRLFRFPASRLVRVCRREFKSKTLQTDLAVQRQLLVLVQACIMIEVTGLMAL